MLLTLQLVFNVLQLASQPLRHLLLLSNPDFELFVLGHLLGCGPSHVSHLLMKLSFDVVQLDVLLTLDVVLIVKVLNLLLQVLLRPQHFLSVGLGLLCFLVGLPRFILNNLSVLKHALLETSDLMLKALVVLLHLARLHYLAHQILQFFVDNGPLLSVLLLLTH